MKRPNAIFAIFFCYGALGGVFMEATVRSFMGFEAYMISVQNRGDPWHWFFYAILAALCVVMSVREARRHKDLDS